MSSNTEPLSPEYIAAMYVAHGEELRRFLMGLLRDAAGASDCLQATFTKLLERGHETRAESRRAWLFKVAFQEAVLVKRKSATGDRVLRKAAWTRLHESESPESHLFRMESVEKVREALDSLPPDQRQVVRMRVYEEKTFAVIAHELQIPLGTALGRMRTALLKLKKSLDK
jgi:RNA polymerase sigma-70 factor (ECF subfamily)